MIAPRVCSVSLWSALVWILCIVCGDVSAHPLRITPLPSPSPMRWLSSRIAGEGQNGFKDGAFFEAQFNHPQGLVVDDSGDTLYVADSGNARIRKVLLRQGHKTETLAGSGEKGGRDGAFLKAQFDAPTGLALLDANTLLVVERVDAPELPFRLRRLDLVRKVVETLPVQRTSYPGVPSDISDLVGGLEPDVVVLVAKQDPSLLALKLSTGECKRIVLSEPNILKRAVSASLHDRHLLVADGQGDQLISLDMSGWTFSANPPVEAKVVTAVPKISLVRTLGGLVYVTQMGVNCISRVDESVPTGGQSLLPVGMFTGGGVSFPCIIGEPTDDTKRPALYYANSIEPDMIALNPANPRQIFIAHWPWGSIESVRDYDQEALLHNISAVKEWMPDFRYPERKEPGVFRILMVGDSRTFQAGVDPDPTSKITKFDTLAKQLELQLNLSSSMRGVHQQYEVLNLSEVSWFPVWSWGQYRIPRIVREYDIDLVLFSVFEAPPPYLLLQFPLPDTDKELSTEPKQDSEWALTPDVEKGSHGALKGLFDAIRESSPQAFQNDGKLAMPEFHSMCGNDRMRSAMFNCYGKLLTQLHRVVAQANRSADRPVPMLLAYLPEDYEGTTECTSALMKEVSRQSGVPLLNVGPFLTAASSSLYMSHGIGGGHLIKFGFHLYADILADALVHSGAVK